MIEQEVFGARSDLLLLELIAMGRRRRHTLLTAPLYQTEGSSLINDWLQRFPNPVQREVKHILRHGKTASPNQPAGISSVRVVPTGRERWERGYLNAEEALELLRMPLRLLVENHRTDLAFLKWLLPMTKREELEEALREGWIEVQHAGGLGEMTAIVEELATDPDQDRRKALARLRLWVMFDRDSSPKDRSKPSEQSERLKELCTEAGEGDPWPLSHHQLGRRSIENYLPNEALKKWTTHGRYRDTAAQVAKMKALRKMEASNPLARWQYNMKFGLLGDVSKATKDEVQEKKRFIRDDELDKLFHGLDEDTRQRLEKGFGNDIAELFSGDVTQGLESGFEREYDKGPPDQPTREELARALFARM